jgi:hypothetical protein
MESREPLVVARVSATRRFRPALGTHDEQGQDPLPKASRRWRCHSNLAQRTSALFARRRSHRLSRGGAEVTGISAPIDRFTILSGRITFEEPCPPKAKVTRESCRVRQVLFVLQTDPFPQTETGSFELFARISNHALATEF